MKNYTRIYLKGMGYDITEEPPYIPCENCNLRPVVDCHHLEPRGRGGSKSKDFIENLIGLCRECHILAEAKKISKEELREKHLRNC